MTKKQIEEQIQYYNRRAKGVQMDLKGALRNEVDVLDPENLDNLAITCEQAAQYLRDIKREAGEYFASAYNLPAAAAPSTTTTSEKTLVSFTSSREEKIAEAIGIAISLYKGGRHFIKIIRDLDR